MLSNLKPCPHCGRDAGTEETLPEMATEVEYKVECIHCGCQTPSGDKEYVEELWNTRTPEVYSVSKAVKEWETLSFNDHPEDM